ncbi:hypothetical protein ACFIJ5_09710 [Haloimpatiens sp. FM7330]|uniref:hypothetical protein n=1 Tax=Haloimpatiens sp. FM7330 TaxID=3298610 RepID=UPI003639C730
MTKYCIFDKNKVCDDCGECYKCELDPKKTCDNCGKCMELEGYDVKQIKIDEVLETPDEVKQYKKESYEENIQNILDNMNLTDEEKKKVEEFKKKIEENKNKVNDDDNLEMEYIDDNEGIKDILNDESKFKNMADEVFPGFIKINGKLK